MQLLRQNVFILKVFISKVFILIQLLITANAMDINTDYYITNSTLASIYHGSSVVVGKETRSKIRGFEPGECLIFLMNFFVY